MPPASTVEASLVSRSSHGFDTIVNAAAAVCLIWYCVVWLVCTVGYMQLHRWFSSPRPPALIRPNEVPHVTVIRPVKGLEPRLYDCLASTFRQDYPKDKLHICFCVSDRNDAAIPIITQLLADFGGHDATLLLEEEDEALASGRLTLGPNPKIRNMSRAYREAAGNVIWVIDCNVWVAKGTCSRMVSKLEGYGEQRRNKYVHQLPIVVDVDGSTSEQESRALLSGGLDVDSQIRTTSSASATVQSQSDRTAFSIGGGRLEECFMASAHPKFYTAINTVLIAPCSVGKSTMFRKTDLNSVTNDAGIDFFSENICEDHLIGDRLWKHQVSAERNGEKMGKHAMCFGDLALQPMANMSLGEYWRRRVRWLRVRKFTVTLATFVEPGTESFLCSLYGAFAFTTLPFCYETFGGGPTRESFALFWFASVAIWCLVDRMQYLLLHSGASIQVDEDTPFFARPPQKANRRPFGEWLLAWLGREALALPIWFWAFYGGTRVEWRGRKFWVGMDMKVHEILYHSRTESGNGNSTSRSTSKDRQD